MFRCDAISASRPTEGQWTGVVCEDAQERRNLARISVVYGYLCVMCLLRVVSGWNMSPFLTTWMSEVNLYKDCKEGDNTEVMDA